MRRVAAFVIAPVLAALALAGCGSSSSTSSAGASSSSSSSSSAPASSATASASSSAPTSTSASTYSQVTVTGAFDKAPTVTIPKVQGAGALLTKTLIQGTGATLTSTEGLVGNYVAYVWSGATSKQLGSSYTTGKPSLFSGQLLPGLETALVGQKLGSRVLAVIPPQDGFGTSGNSSAGIKGTDTLVFVIDMGSSFSENVVPGKQTSSGGGSLPTVTAPAASSTAGPTIKIPAKVTAPTKLEVSTLIKGTGAKVAKGDELVVNYTGVNYRTGKVFDSSWSRKQAYDVEIGQGEVIKGWDTGLVGQTVGSRVLLVIPPADGYGKTGQSTAGIEGTDDLVFVVDILAAE